MFETRRAIAPGPRRTSRRLAVVSVLLLNVLGASGFVTAAHAHRPLDSSLATADGEDSLVTFGVQPVQPKDKPFRANFVYELSPGQEIRDTVRVFNYSSSPLKLSLLATDAFNSDSGAQDMLNTATAPKDLGSWIKLEKTDLTITGNDRVDVPFTIKVPSTGIEPGDHTGGILASYLGTKTAADGTALKLDRRIGNRVQIRVTGPLNPKLAITDLKTTYDNTMNPAGGGTMNVTYTVKNVGNVRLGANPTIKISSPIGFPSRTIRPEAVTEVLPGNAVTLTSKVSGVWPTIRAKTAVTLTAVTTLPGDDFNATTSGAKADAANWTLPLALVVALLLLFGAFKLHQRRQRRLQDAKARELAALVDARFGQPSGTGQPAPADVTTPNGYLS